MTRFARCLIFVGVAALAASAYAASGDMAAAPPTGAAEVPPANQPAQPAGTPPGGFPAIIVPVAIAVGAAVGLSTGDSDSVQITGTATGTN